MNEFNPRRMQRIPRGWFGNTLPFALLIMVGGTLLVSQFGVSQFGGGLALAQSADAATNDAAVDPEKADPEKADPEKADPEKADPEKASTAQQPGTLPWEQGQPESRSLPPRELSHARELFELYGIAESQLNMLADGAALGADDEEALVRILYRMPQFPLDALPRWSVQPWDPQSFAASPAEHRCDSVRLAGRARGLRRVELSPELSKRMDFSSYFVVSVRSEDPPCDLEICTHAIPKAWKPGPLDEPVSAWGMFLKSGGTPEVPTLVFVTPRVAWHPDRVSEAALISPDHLVLAQLGMDIGLFDAVRGRNRKGIESQDSECFYHLLAAVGRAEPGQLDQLAQRDPPLAPLLSAPRQQQGKLISLSGTARRVTKILVGEKDLQARFGFDHYFQLDVFVPLGNQIVQLGDPDKATGDVPTFAHSYPITLCTRQLPPGLREGDDLRQEVRFAAVYFKLWSYRSEYISSFDDRHLQISPMLIGRDVALIEIESATNPWIGVVAGILFLAILSATWYGLWRSGRSDRRFERDASRRRSKLQDGKSLDDLEASSGPDFSNLG